MGGEKKSDHLNMLASYCSRLSKISLLRYKRYMDYSALLIRNTTKMKMNSIFNFYKISFKMLFEECYHLILLNFTQALRSWKTAKDKNSPILCVLENGLLLRPTHPHMSQKIIADGPSCLLMTGQRLFQFHLCLTND